MINNTPALSQENIDLVLSSNPDGLTPSESLASLPIGLCRGCEGHLEWQSPVVGQRAAAVTCPNCGRCCFINEQGKSSVEKKDGASQPMPPTPNRSASKMHSVTEVLLEKLLESDSRTTERRRDIRYPTTHPIVGIPLNDSLLPSCDTISMTLIDLSLTGAGVICDEGFYENLIIFDFNSLGCPGIQLLAQVRWRVFDGDAMKVGFEFVSDIGVLPTSLS